jgi:ankyrin repeat protein
LSFAAIHGYTEVVEALLKGGADTQVADARGWTALDYAYWNNRPAVVKMLNEAGQGRT